MGSRGDSYDNALAESVIGLYKAELVERKGPWRGLDDLEYALEWVDWFNHRRLFSAIGYVPPAEYEANLYRGEIRDAAKTGDAAEAAGLTPREREVLVSFAQGMSYARIAEVRGIKPVSVRNTVYGIQAKLKVDSMQGLVLWAVRNGLLDDWRPPQ